MPAAVGQATGLTVVEVGVAGGGIAWELIGRVETGTVGPTAGGADRVARCVRMAVAPRTNATHAATSTGSSHDRILGLRLRLLSRLVGESVGSAAGRSA